MEIFLLSIALLLVLVLLIVPNTGGDSGGTAVDPTEMEWGDEDMYVPDESEDDY